MKQRNGFVSNSSSSSFVILGYKIAGTTYDNYVGLCEIFEQKPASHEEYEWSWYDKWDELFSSQDLTFYSDSDCDGNYIGIGGTGYEYDTHSYGPINANTISSLIQMSEKVFGTKKVPKIYAGMDYS
jgi:hypothetical protein